VFDECVLQEVWTLCRIFKRIPSFKKYTPNLKDTKSNTVNSNTSTIDSDNCKPYLICRDTEMMQQLKPVFGQVDEKKHLYLQPPSSTPYPTFWNHNVEDYTFANENWDDLRSVVQFAIHPSSVFDCTETHFPPYFS